MILEIVDSINPMSTVTLHLFCTLFKSLVMRNFARHCLELNSTPFDSRIQQIRLFSTTKVFGIFAQGVVESEYRQQYGQNLTVKLYRGQTTGVVSYQ